MFASLKSNVWNVLVADPSPFYRGFCKIINVTWQGYASANDQVLVKDGDGNVILASYGNVDLSPISAQVENPVWMRDPTLVAMDSGRLVVYVR